MNIVWCLRGDHDDDPDYLPPFPFQVYVVDEDVGATANPEFPVNFALLIERFGGIADGGCKYHFQVYSSPGPNILSCIAHQRKEVAWRNCTRAWPRMIQKWTSRDDEGYKGFILVIDREDWARNGFVLVKFDPAAYDRPSQIEDPDTAGGGIFDLVHAVRHRDLSTVVWDGHLMEWWREAGHTFTQNDLETRNNGVLGPTFNPVIEPVALPNAQEGIDEPSAQAATDPEHETDDPWRAIKHLPSHLKSYRYECTDGTRAVSVWDGRKNTTRPHFSFTIYCAHGIWCKVPKAIFNCLNQGLIQHEPWTLDVNYGFETIEAAYEHFMRNIEQRPVNRTMERTQCMRKVLQKVAGHVLPKELLDLIEHMLVPPAIPLYDSLPHRQFRKMFLWLPSSRTSDGPLVVCTDAKPLLEDPDVLSSDTARQRVAWSRPDLMLDDVLRVVALGHWSRVADELHILWSLCATRAFPEHDLPRARLEISMPKLCVVGDNPNVKPEVSAKLAVSSSQPIVLMEQRILSHDIWEEAFDVVDLKTDTVLPRLPFKENPTICLADSFNQSPRLDLQPLSDGGGLFGPPPTMLSPKAGHDDYEFPELTSLWWWDRICTDILRCGNEYALRLRDGVTIPRWTYGRVGELEGPFNLPPIPITMGKEVRFKFAQQFENVYARCNSDDATHVHDLAT